MIRKIILNGILVLFCIGCSTATFSEGGKVIRVDPQAIYDTDIGFSSEDLHMVVEKMVGDMLHDKIFDGTPVIDVRKIENRTDEHIDTEAITDSIRTIIIKSKRARFVDSSKRRELIHELEYQNRSKYIDKDKAKAIGKHIAQGYILDGAITSIKQRNNQQVSYFYKVTLQLHNIETATIDWIDEKEIRKIYRK